jgi:hypothetical protein
MSGLASVLAGRTPAGIYHWHGAFDVEDVRHTVEHAGQAFGHVDGWTHPTKAEFLAAVGETFAFPDYYGQNFDALADLLHDVGAGGTGTVLLWDGWGPLAREDEKAFSIALSVLGARVNADRGGPFTVLLRGEGPPVAGVTDLD